MSYLSQTLVLITLYITLSQAVCAQAEEFVPTDSDEQIQKDNSTEQYEMILIGGALHTCASMSERYCEDTDFSDAKRTTLYSINEASTDRLINFIKTSPHENALDGLSSVLDALITSKEKTSIDRRELFDLFDSLGVLSEVDSLSDFEYYALLDFLEDQQQKEGVRLKELVDPFASKNDASIQIWKEISKQALTINKDKENIKALAITASARDNFEAVDFYVGGLSAIGLDAHWLPVSAALVEAINAKKTDDQACQRLEYYRQKHHQFDRARVYPDLHEIQITYCKNPKLIQEQIRDASAVFFNGGDQSKALAAFMQKNGRSTDYAEVLRQQFRQKELLIVGTSAGTAVQSGGVFNGFPTVMISNGTSGNAITRGVFGIDAPSQRCVSDDCDNGIQGDDLTYRTLGGLSTFQLGVMDTHFSERNREARLIALTQATRNSFGFGVDETTALMVSGKDASNYAFEVIGSQGVFVADNSVYENSVSKQLETASHTYGGFAHFFPAGTQARIKIDTGQWQVDFTTCQKKSI